MNFVRFIIAAAEACFRSKGNEPYPEVKARIPIALRTNSKNETVKTLILDANRRFRVAYYKPVLSLNEAFFCALGNRLGVPVPKMLLDRHEGGYSLALPRRRFKAAPRFFANLNSLEIVGHRQQTQLKKILEKSSAFETGRMLGFLIWSARGDNYGNNFLVEKKTDGTRQIIPFDFEGVQILGPTPDWYGPDLKALVKFTRQVYQEAGKGDEFHAGLKDMVHRIDQISKADLDEVTAPFIPLSRKESIAGLEEIKKGLLIRQGLMKQLVYS